MFLIDLSASHIFGEFIGEVDMLLDVRRRVTGITMIRILIEHKGQLREERFKE